MALGELDGDKLNKSWWLGTLPGPVHANGRTHVTATTPRVIGKSDHGASASGDSVAETFRQRWLYMYESDVR
jgi:hypothetical protein